MKQITEKDINKLYQKFKRYLLNAEQYEYIVLFEIDKRFDITMERIEKESDFIETHQKDLNAMFRVVLKAMGENYSNYLDEEEERSWVERVKEDKYFKKYNYELKQVDNCYVLASPMLPETIITIWEGDQYKFQVATIGGIHEDTGEGDNWIYMNIKLIMNYTEEIHRSLVKQIKERGSSKEAFNKLKAKLGELTEEEEKLLEKVEKGLDALVVFKQHIQKEKDGIKIELENGLNEDYLTVIKWLGGEKDDDEEDPIELI